MADNTTLNPGTGGDTIATDDVGGVKYQYVKLTDGTADSSAVIPGSATDGLLVNLGANNDVTVAGVATAANQTTGNTSLATIAGAVSGTEMQVDVLSMPSTAVTNAGTFVVQENGAALTALQLIDDTVQVLGTDTYTEAASKGITIGAVRRDADTTLVNTTNEFGPLQMDANGRLKVEAFSGEALPITDNGSSITVDAAAGGLVVGDGTNPVVVLADGADNVSNASNQLITAGMNYAYDGTTWDRVPNGGGVEAAAMRVTIANDSTGLLSVDDNGASLSVDWNGTQPVTGSGTATGALRVELANNGTGVISTVSTVTSITNSVTVQGGAANASPVSGNPLLMAGRASNAIPTDVGADGDAASLWTNRNGAQINAVAPHVGLNGDPWSLVHEAAQYTTTQTSTVLVAGGASEKIVVTKVQIQVGGTTAGALQLYFGTGAFSRGTSRCIFDGEFAPSATLKPGVVMDGPFIAGANGDDLMVTTSTAINPLTINIWYYVVT